MVQFCRPMVQYECVKLTKDTKVNEFLEVICPVIFRVEHEIVGTQIGFVVKSKYGAMCFDYDHWYVGDGEGTSRISTYTDQEFRERYELIGG